MSYDKYGICKECSQPNTSDEWCNSCNAERFQQNFKNWTSNDNNIDKFIQHTQLSATCREKVLEWIPYDRFKNIECIAKGGFGNVYKAIWIDGYIRKWDNENNNWKRYDASGNYLVALKSLNNSKNVGLEFINEITSHHRLNNDYLSGPIIGFYGMTKDPETKNYMMILQYADHGSLRNYLDKTMSSCYDKINYLSNIASGINTIHEKGFIHRDLHTGNILKTSDSIYICDMGLCKPADYNNISESAQINIYGVLPCVAPEILRGQSYTKASDIYSFGIIMYEVISELPPYYDLGHDENLAIKICKGFRPKFNTKVPQLIVSLIKRCLDANPLNRPTAKELWEILEKWYNETGNNEPTEIRKQIEAAYENNPSSLSTSFEIHKKAIYTGRLLNFNNLPEPKNSEDYYDEENDNLSTKFPKISESEISQRRISIPLYGNCIKCKQPRSRYQWCQPCEQKRYEENFVNRTSGNEEIDKFLQNSQLKSTNPQTFLEWIPFDRLENINILDITSKGMLYSAFWKDGPRTSWDQQNEQYKRSKIQVTIKSYKDSDDKDQVNNILDELQIYLDCHAKECTLLFRFYGISKEPESNDYFIVKQFPQKSSLKGYISNEFNNLYWEEKLHLLLCLAEDLKALHDAGYIHRYLHPSSVLVFDNRLCAIGTFSKCCKALPISNTEEIIGWQHYMAPEYLRYEPYTKASDIYSFGMVMHTVGTGNIPYYPLCIDYYLIDDVCLGLRPNISDNIPKSFKNLVEKCWNTDPDLRPNIHEVYNTILNLWSSIYHNKHLDTLNSICLEFIASDNRDDSISQKARNTELEYDAPFQEKIISEQPELIKLIMDNRLVKVINMDKLLAMKNVEGSTTISKATWKKTNDIVICKRLKNIKSNEAFLYGLKIHNKTLDFCPRIMRILGVSFDKNTNEYLLIMEYAEGGNLREYFIRYFKILTWDNKIKLAHQITEGIKYLHDEKLHHRDLHPRNVMICQGQAKIVFGIAKDTGTNNLEMISYIDPKLLENHSYEYNEKSDIYSLGILMWELSSGKPPFMNEMNESILRSNLINGYRENPIPDTPNEYVKLYESCWDPEPSARPPIDQVFSRLEKMNTQNKKSFDPSELINLIMNNGFVKVINMDDLSEITNNIDGGHFGIISKAIWSKTRNTVICKRLRNNQSISNKPIVAFLHELEMHRRLDFCQRIIRVLGISFDETTKEHLFIMQYADGGNLRKYLEDHEELLTINDRIKLAYQIAEGIKYLHGEKILHRDLHSKNIVVHQGEAKIIDLGIAKSTETETHHHSGVFGMTPYIDPKILENYSYKYNKKSDIYSLGVLMWELSSCKPPFMNEMNESILRLQLIDGHREDPNPDAPGEYVKLYESCWDSEPNVRPSIDRVFTKLGEILGIHDGGDNHDTKNDGNKDSKNERTTCDDNDDLFVPVESLL